MYPDEAMLKAIEEWPHQDFLGLIEYIRPYWEGYGRIRIHQGKRISYDGRPVTIVSLATGGWSGNEDIMQAIMSNQMVKAMYYYAWKVGGLHIFKLPSSAA